MTAVADLRSSSAPKRNWLILAALALSLTLNVFVIGGLVWSMAMAPRPMQLAGPGERLLAAARSVDLSAEQRGALRAFIAVARENNRDLRDQNGPLMHEMWREMGNAQPDTARIAQISQQAMQNRLDYQKKLADGLMGFLAKLSPEQRSQIVALAAQRPPAPGPGQRPLDRP